jgi:quercetin dioxygenase-like cupin family protein
MESPRPQPYPFVEIDEGVSRRVLSQNADLMTVEFLFRKGAVGALHHHVHVQSTFVRSGKFRFTVDSKEMELGVGDSIIIPSNAVHGCVALETGCLIDTFTPRRDDFL